MEEEENNNLNYGNITGHDTITTVTGDYLIDVGNLTHGSYSLWSTSSYNMDFKLPDIFLKVIKKMMPEIKMVVVAKSEIKIDNLNNIGEVLIYLFIIFNETHSYGKNYQEKIGDLFKMTFPNIDYVNFNVIEFDSNNNKKFDKIIELFG